MRNLMIQLLLRFMGNHEPGPFRMRIGSWMLRNVPGMLTCPQVEEFVADYYDRTLAPKQSQRFETHMKLCPMCRAHFDGYVRAIALGQRVCAEDDEMPEGMPDELAGAILLALRQQSGSGST